MGGRERASGIGTCSHHGATHLLRLPMMLTAALLGACGGNSETAAPMGSAPNQAEPPAVMKAFDAGAPVDPALVAADNAFGCNLLDTLMPNNTGNLAISPISVAMALQVVYDGAAGSTQQAMARTLQIDGFTNADLDTANAALEGSLVNPDSQVQISLANSLWMHLSDNPVSSSFTQNDTTYYGATIGDLAGAPSNVNAWVSGQTHGLITQILPAEPASYYREIIAIVVNVLYFKGQWSQGFDVNDTAAASFTRTDGTTVDVEMMNQTENFGYFRGSDFQVLNLPYGNGRLSMVIVLPDAGVDIAGFTAGMTAPTLAAWINELQATSVAVSLPRFDTRFGSSLVPALTSLGMGIAFCQSFEADLSGISPLACISDVEHETVVQVDESGTIAAAATSVGAGITAVIAPEATMTMNHPFFYAIRDNETGELLFIGILRDPTAS